MKSMEEIRRIFEELNFPSAQRLKQALRAEGIAFDPKDVDDLVRREPSRQIQGKPYDFKGKIASKEPHDRWFADLIDFTAAPSEESGKDVGLRPTSSGQQYVLAVQDVFSRKIWTEALRSKSSIEVADAFDRIVDRVGEKPRSLTTDMGTEFTSQSFRTVAERLGIDLRHKSPEDINAIATLDNAIGQLKKAMARDARRQGTNDWASRLQKVTTGQNRVPNEEYLEGVAPANVERSEDMVAMLKEKNQKFSHLNAERRDRRARRLREDGGFRTITSRGGAFTRGFKPRYSTNIHTAERLNRGKVYDEANKEHDTRFVLSVPIDTAELGEPVNIERPGSEQTRRKQREILQPFAERIADVLADVGEGTATSAIRYVDSPEFRAARDRARIRSRTARAFFDIFPEMFTVRVVGGRTLVSGNRAPPPPPAPAVAPPPVVVRDGGVFVRPPAEGERRGPFVIRGGRIFVA